MTNTIEQYEAEIARLRYELGEFLKNHPSSKALGLDWDENEAFMDEDQDFAPKIEFFASAKVGTDMFPTEVVFRW